MRVPIFKPHQTSKTRTFRAPDWDSDADGDNKCEELFKASSSQQTLGITEKVLRNSKLTRQIQKRESPDVNVITVQTKIALGKRKEFSSSSKSVTTYKQFKKESSSELEDEFETRLKQSSQNCNLSDSEKLSKELRREKKKKKKLKKKLERAAKEQLMLSKALKAQGKDVVQVKKVKEEPIDEPGPSRRDRSVGVKPECGKEINIPESLRIIKKIQIQEKLKTMLKQAEKRENKPVMTLRQKMMEKLRAARFRFLNEQIYKTDSREAQRIFKSDPEAFTAYHEGYRQQVKSWPLNPLAVIVKAIKKMPKTHIIADLGCGEAKLSKSVEQKVYSFDLVAVDKSVIACDMANVPLPDASVDVAVFCLSLMGTNLGDYLLEANRVLKIGGVLKIVEVESRFENVDNFMEAMQRFGFKKLWKDLSHNLFYFMDFKKVVNVKNKKKLPTISLLPCLYKKR